MNAKTNIKNLDLRELGGILSGLGVEPYRVRQIAQWIFQKDIASFDEMTNVKKTLLAVLNERFILPRLSIASVQSSADGTRKFLIALEGGRHVECVLIPEPKRTTLCVSSQVGCGMGCKFCLTATMGVIRNLSVYEILEQVACVRRFLRDMVSPVEPRPVKPITNLVFMGMGEPLANTKNLYRALEILIDPHGFGFSRQHITVSTSGLAPEIEKFGHQTPVKLAISLNATTDEVRSEVMPINRKYPLARLIEACRKMHLPKRNRITFEYVMLHDVNDTMEDAKRLVKFLLELKAKINLIPFNEFPGSPFKRPPDDWVLKFQKVLLDKGFVANIRKSRGRDILGACGQLAVQPPHPHTFFG